MFHSFYRFAQSIDCVMQSVDQQMRAILILYRIRALSLKSTSQAIFASYAYALLPVLQHGVH